jgi:LPXTG-site transpeptidase (sortase) family protein
MTLKNDMVKKTRPNLLLLFGLLLLIWGYNGTVDVIKSISPAEDPANQSLDSADEGFSPYLVPVTGAGLSSPESVLKAGVVSDSSGDSLINIQKDQSPGQPPSKMDDFTGIPDRIVIPAIELNAPILFAKFEELDYQGQTYDQWLAPNSFAAGWHFNSVRLGNTGNLVLDGHHNVYGKVFGRLYELEEGDLIRIYSGSFYMKFVVTNKLILPEKNTSLATRLENARWILPTSDQRLTLVTCWPQDTNTHRLVIAAIPASALLSSDQ